jgi:MFS family permease
MFGVALPALAGALALSRAQAGLLGSVTLVASAIGGWIAGALSDRFGRVRVFQWTILWFAVFTLLGGLAQTYTQLLVLRACHGLGFGGEWTAGAVLLAEAIRPAHRGKALGFVQSAWAVGWAASVVAYAGLFTWLSPALAWRVLFVAGALPALLVIRLRRRIPEPGPSRGMLPRGDGQGFAGIFAPALLRTTLVGALLGVGAHGGYYALMTWLPTYLKTERGLSVLGTSGYLAVIIFAFWLGCLVSAALQDRIGRRRNLAAFAVGSVATVLVYLFVPLANHPMLLLGFPLGFFAAGIPSTLGALFNELYPGGLRGTGVGFCYNFGRVASAAFPWLVGLMSESMPLGRAIGLDAATAYGLVVVAAIALPETKGRSLAVGTASIPAAAGELAAVPNPRFLP